MLRPSKLPGPRRHATTEEKTGQLLLELYEKMRRIKQPGYRVGANRQRYVLRFSKLAGFLSEKAVAPRDFLAFAMSYYSAPYVNLITSRGAVANYLTQEAGQRKLRITLTDELKILDIALRSGMLPSQIFAVYRNQVSALPMFLFVRKHGLMGSREEEQTSEEQDLHENARRG